jgi:hypothetical protein
VVKTIAVFSVLSGLSFLVRESHAQFFVGERSPCPQGSGVKMDTIFYSPDKDMPFDRCFYLTYTLKGDHKITYFTISPVDMSGQVHNRRRDKRHRRI